MSRQDLLKAETSTKQAPPYSLPIDDLHSEDDDLEELADELSRLDVDSDEDGEDFYTPRASPALEEPCSHPLDFTRQFERVAVVTTAAPPWLTGTAVNPAIRAAYLQNMGHDVTLVVPFIPPAQQSSIFSEGIEFPTPPDQLPALMEAIDKRVDFPLHGLKVIFYPGRYDTVLGSIIPEGNVQEYVPEETNLVILEEPEHLTWYHTGRRWTKAFPHVVGIMHTNYVDYISRTAGKAAAGTIQQLNRFLVGQHVQLAIKLSDAVQTLPRQVTCFVHGVAGSFLKTGDQVKEASEKQETFFTKDAYFLGKVLWAKGYQELIDIFTASSDACLRAGIPQPHIDIFGSGADLASIKREAERKQLSMTFHGPIDHMSPDMREYRAFVNPSTSDVVATTSAEALAMGKWLIVPRHACNVFFESTFRNCLVYEKEDEATFSVALNRALTTEPYPLSDEERSALTWETATQRFADCTAHGLLGYERAGRFRRAAAKTVYMGYNALISAIEAVRRALEAQQRRVQQEREILALGVAA